MSLVFNGVYSVVNGGGGGGPSASDAILIVTTTTGSTVTATKNGVTITPTMWEKAADATYECALFVIPAAQFDSSTPWTVTATDGTNTDTDTIVINSNKQYDMLLDYNIWLVRHGVLLVTFTPSAYANLNQLTDYTQMIITGNNYGRITTQNQIDVTDFATLRVKFYMDNAGKYAQSYYSTYYPTIGVGSSTPSSDTSPNYSKYTRMNSSTGVIPNENYAVDLSDQTGLKYVSMLISSASSLQGYANIYDFYLER